MEINSLLKKIDFTDDEHLKRLNDIVDEEFQNRLSDSQNTDNIGIHEKLLLSAQEQLMPFIKKILDFESFRAFTDLKNAFDYIVKYQKENKSRPFSNIKSYIKLCNNTAFIFDDSDLEDCKEDKTEEISCLCHAYYKEISQKDSDTQIIAKYYGYSIFDEYYNFLSYFAFKPSKEKDITICKSLIHDILFDIIWNIDLDCENKIEDSYFKRAITNIFI